jgi:hypothetical protein
MATRRGGTVTGRLAGRLGFVAVLALFVSACTGSGYHYVKDSKDGAYLKVPDKWKLYSESEFYAHPPPDLSPQDVRDIKKITWVVGFDASPQPSVKNVVKLATDHPTGFARVRPLTRSEHDAFSLQATRRLFVSIDAYVDAGLGKIVEGKDFSRPGGFHGEHVIVDIPVDKKGNPVEDPSVDPNKVRLATIDQTVITDRDTKTLYVLFVSCSAHCYDKNKGAIKTLVDSWTVRET